MNLWEEFEMEFVCFYYFQFEMKDFFFFFEMDLNPTLRVERASLVAQMIKNLLAMQDMQVRSLGWEDPPEKGMTNHSSILSWRIPRTEEPGGLQCMVSQRVGHD